METREFCSRPTRKKLEGKTEFNSCEAKPVLILLDNTDSEKIAELITSVQQKTGETMYFEEPYKYQLKAFLMCKLHLRNQNIHFLHLLS